MDSWKEIAAHFQRDVRTVKRWEQAEGLPVHRHTHTKRASIYAYRGELDAWWNNHTPTREQGTAVVGVHRHRLVWAAGVVGLTLFGVSTFMFWSTPAPPLEFRERDWVLITDFDNRTGDSSFDGLVEYVLERELSNSPFINVVPPERVEDTLRLMRVPLDSPIDPILGREIAQRDGDIRALVAGSAELIESTYLLTVQILDRRDGLVVAAATEEADGERDVLPALTRLSDWARVTLGEKPPLLSDAGPPLQKVTTPSLPALKLYSQAIAMSREEGSEWSVIEELFRQAVTEDPEFASAYIWVAHAMRNQPKPAEEFLPFAERAYELADTTVARERYFVLGSYYWMKGDLERAVEAYKALVRLDPGHAWGLDHLVHTLKGESGRHQEAAVYVAERADLRPTSFHDNFRAFQELAALNLVDLAQPYHRRAMKLMADTPEIHLGEFRHVEFFPAQMHWLNGEARSALKAADRIAGRLKSLSDRATAGARGSSCTQRSAAPDAAGACPADVERAGDPPARHPGPDTSRARPPRRWPQISGRFRYCGRWKSGAQQRFEALVVSHGWTPSFASSRRSVRTA